ncbi:RNA 2',3'-cyclic phosphodiesterase [Weizmannia acidilactici]|uniref:RNA 2',3'-cyclic phosphodiesterase n=1 Tax=Weizmannia acidilactici TaxID=2607726 RepID=A0A5J4J2Z9_9BACI|nr:RNA 2',3'-cyclic phosphodiesterase [Weizmannia acidilactici]GER66462.1 RNA 2',3'-cyclic phosphodiesterase [Weizmannia acidilactici]GER69392.1 RNA 2',3'-cyclic phosphodiesterase [Weizmannia acidilactici]GER72280.1 RNA 2',3'-cyclic phosphodiesterase [Weizmannia acidilactici]
MVNHYFYAVWLPEEIKTVLQQAAENMKTGLPFQRWVHRDDYHITLAFLGAAGEDQLEKANRAIAGEIVKYGGFPLVLDHFGTFGKKDEPRVLWAGTRASELLSGLQKMVARCCLDTGFRLDKKPFNPHITLARKWRGDLPFQAGVLDGFLPQPAHFQAERIVLYETHLDRMPKYEMKQSFRLGSNNMNLK